MCFVHVGSGEEARELPSGLLQCLEDDHHQPRCSEAGFLAAIFSQGLWNLHGVSSHCAGLSRPTAVNWSCILHLCNSNV